MRFYWSCNRSFSTSRTPSITTHHSPTNRLNRLLRLAAHILISILAGNLFKSWQNASIAYLRTHVAPASSAHSAPVAAELPQPHAYAPTRPATMPLPCAPTRPPAHLAPARIALSNTGPRPTHKPQLNLFSSPYPALAREPPPRAQS